MANRFGKALIATGIALSSLLGNSNQAEGQIIHTHPVIRPHTHFHPTYHFGLHPRNQFGIYPINPRNHYHPGLQISNIGLNLMLFSHLERQRAAEIKRLEIQNPRDFRIEVPCEKVPQTFVSRCFTDGGDGVFDFPGDAIGIGQKNFNERDPIALAFHLPVDCVRGLKADIKVCYNPTGEVVSHYETIVPRDRYTFGHNFQPERKQFGEHTAIFTLDGREMGRHTFSVLHSMESPRGIEKMLSPAEAGLQMDGDGLGFYIAEDQVDKDGDGLELSELRGVNRKPSEGGYDSRKPMYFGVHNNPKSKIQGDVSLMILDGDKIIQQSDPMKIGPDFTYWKADRKLLNPGRNYSVAFSIREKDTGYCSRPIPFKVK